MPGDLTIFLEPATRRSPKAKFKVSAATKRPSSALLGRHRLHGRPESRRPARRPQVCAPTTNRSQSRSWPLFLCPVVLERASCRMSSLRLLPVSLTRMAPSLACPPHLHPHMLSRSYMYGTGARSCRCARSLRTAPVSKRCWTQSHQGDEQGRLGPVIGSPLSKTLSTTFFQAPFKP